MRRTRTLTADEKDDASLRGQREYRRGTSFSALGGLSDGDEALALIERGWRDQQRADVDGSIWACEKAAAIPSHYR